jgi:hypothetical protein
LKTVSLADFAALLSLRLPRRAQQIIARKPGRWPS